jgi:hypothetical protein
VNEKTSPFIRLLDACVACSKPAHKRRKKDLASRLMEHQRKQSTQGQRNLPQRRHQQSIPLQTRRKIVTTKNSSDQHRKLKMKRKRERKKRKRKESETVSGGESASGRERRGSEREKGRETSHKVSRWNRCSVYRPAQ